MCVRTWHRHACQPGKAQPLNPLAGRCSPPAPAQVGASAHQVLAWQQNPPTHICTTLKPCQRPCQPEHARLPCSCAVLTLARTLRQSTPGREQSVHSCTEMRKCCQTCTAAQPGDHDSFPKLRMVNLLLKRNPALICAGAAAGQPVANVGCKVMHVGLRQKPGRRPARARRPASWPARRACLIRVYVGLRQKPGRRPARARRPASWPARRA